MQAWFSVGYIAILNEKVTRSDYTTTFDEIIHSMAQTSFPAMDCTFQEAIHTVGTIQFMV